MMHDKTMYNYLLYLDEARSSVVIVKYSGYGTKLLVSGSVDKVRSRIGVVDNLVLLFRLPVAYSRNYCPGTTSERQNSGQEHWEKRMSQVNAPFYSANWMFVDQPYRICSNFSYNKLYE